MDGCAGSLHADGCCPGGIRSPPPGRGRPHLPHRSGPLQRPPRRRCPQPPGRRLLDGLPSRADHPLRGRDQRLLRREDRHPVRMDRRSRLPPPRKYGRRLLALAQRPARGRGQRPADPRGVRPDTLRAAGSQLVPRADARPAPGDRRPGGAASALRKQLPLLPEPAFDRRLRDRAGPRHAGARVRHARPEDHRLQRLQLRRTRHRRL